MIYPSSVPPSPEDGLQALNEITSPPLVLLCLSSHRISARVTSQRTLACNMLIRAWTRVFTVDISTAGTLLRYPDTSLDLMFTGWNIPKCPLFKIRMSANVVLKPSWLESRHHLVPYRLKPDISNKPSFPTFSFFVFLKKCIYSEM